MNAGRLLVVARGQVCHKCESWHPTRFSALSSSSSPFSFSFLAFFVAFSCNGMRVRLVDADLFLFVCLPERWLAGSNTGYKGGEASRPCNRCWSSYGLKYPEQVVRVLMNPRTASQLELQRGLPDWRSGSSRALWFYSTPVLPVVGGDGAGRTNLYNTSLQAAQQNAAQPQPQPQPQPQSRPRPRPEPPRTNRTTEARLAEAEADGEGEAPPAYDEVARVRPDIRLPPQRIGDTEGSTAAHGGHASTGLPSPAAQHTHASLSSAPSAPAPAPAPAPPISSSGALSASHHGAFATHPTAASSLHAQHVARPYLPPQHTGMSMGMGPTSPTFPPQQQQPMAGRRFNGRPPAGALIVRPGDPRIGGRLCWKCDGRGVRER